MTRKLALLRGVNVGGRKLPMAELRALCAGLGWDKTETYIQSGNLLFEAPGKDADLETALEQAIARQFGFEIAVIVRTAGQWSKLVDGNPFAERVREEPNRIQLYVAKRPIAKDAAEKLLERGRHGETARRVGEALWFHFPEGVGVSKITPALIDKACGSPATGRNYRTVVTLNDMLAA